MVAQATSCDGNLYPIFPDGDNTAQSDVILTIKPLPNGPKWMETKVILLIILESSIHSQTSERLRKPLSLTEWDDGKT